MIIYGTWSLFRQSLHLLFDGVPEHIALADVRRCLEDLPGVLSVHDLHVWAMATSDIALTAHLVVGEHTPNPDELLRTASDVLHDRFDIRHVTLQVEGAGFSIKRPSPFNACPG